MTPNGQQPGHVGEEPGTVGRDNAHPAARRLPRDDALHPLARQVGGPGQRRLLQGRQAGQRSAGRGDQITDEPRPPRVPRVPTDRCRIRHRECMQEVEGEDVVAHRCRERCHRGRVGRIAAGSELGQREVLAHQGEHERGVGGRHTPAVQHRSGEPLPLGGVLDRRGALADVVQERSDEQQVRTGDPSHEFGGPDHALQAVSVHRMPVHWAVLGAAAHERPLGQPVLDDARQIERFPGRHERRSGGQQLAQRLQRAGIPRDGSRGLAQCCREVGERCGGERAGYPCGLGRRTQRGHEGVGRGRAGT